LGELVHPSSLASALVLALASATLPLARAASGGDAGAACWSTTPLDVDFPQLASSPEAALKTSDVVFLGEVGAPLRPCRLGSCVGFKVLAVAKGTPGRSVVATLARAPGAGCAGAPFAVKGERWLVFARAARSAAGTRYVVVDPEGPSTLARELPDLARLERRYRLLRASLDDAIERQAKPKPSPTPEP
jgi:hypothetical protein